MKNIRLFNLALLLVAVLFVQDSRAQDTLKGHTDGVRSVVFSPDGTMLASASYDETIKLWDVESREEIATLEGHTDWVRSVVFSPDGTLLASASWDNTVKLWDGATRAEIATLKGHTEAVSSVVFSPDGTRLASASRDNTVKLWDVASRAEIATLEGHTSWVNSVVFSPDGTRLASGSDDETIKLWDGATGRNIASFYGHTSWVNSVVFSPDGTRLASASLDGTVKLWDVVGSTRTLAKISGDEQQGVFGSTLANPLVVEVRDLDNNPLPSVEVTFTVTDGEGLLNGESTVAHVTTDANGRAARTFTLGHDSITNAVEVSIGYGLVRFRAVGVSPYLIATLEGHTNFVFSVVFSPDGTRLASASRDNTVKLWDVTTRAEIATLEGHTSWVFSVVFSPEGTRLASGSADGTVKLWDVASGAEIATLEGHTNGVSSVVFSPDGTRLASGSADGTVKLWDVASGAEIATLEGHTNGVSSVVFSPDGTMLASGSADGTVKLWDVASGAEIATLEGHTWFVSSVVFSPDGTMLASGSADGTVKLWDVSEWAGEPLPLPPLPPLPSKLVKISGDDQEGMSGAALANPLIVEVRDQDDNPLPDVQVTFTITAGYGKLSGQSTVEHATTDANGRAEAILTLGPIPGTNTVGVSLGLRALFATFNAVGVGTPDTPSSMDGDYRTWHLPDGVIARLGKGSLGDVAFSPDGQRLAVASGIGVWLYDVATSRELALLPTASLVNSVVFSPDGTMLASASYDETVKLWDVASRAEIATLEGHTDWVRSVVFCGTPDGTDWVGWLPRHWMAQSSCGTWQQEQNRYPRRAYGLGQYFRRMGHGWLPRHTVKLWDGAEQRSLLRAYGLGLVGGIFAGWDDAGFRVI